MNWTVLATGAGDGPTTEIALDAPVTYRHLEIEQTGSSSNNWWSIHEINVYAPPANAPLPLPSWLQFHFGDSPEALDADGDGDGKTTFEEFAANTIPTDAGSNSAATSSVGADAVQFTFRRWRRDVENGVFYRVELSGDLAGWAESGTVIGAISNRDGTETVTVQAAFADGAQRGFARLSVRETP